MVSWRVVCAPNIITCHWYYIICTLQFHFSKPFFILASHTLLHSICLFQLALLLPSTSISQTQTSASPHSNWNTCPHMTINPPHHPIKGNNSSSLHMEEGTWLLGQHVNFGCREFFFLLLFFLFLLFVVVVVAYYTAMPFSRTGGQISRRLIFIYIFEIIISLPSSMSVSWMWDQIAVSGIVSMQGFVWKFLWAR